MTEQQQDFANELQQQEAIPEQASAPIGRWYKEGARTTLLLPPRWTGLQATPAAIAIIVVTSVLLNLGLERLYIVGLARFYWQAIASGWFGTAITAWVCYLMRPQPLQEQDADAAPSAAHLFCMMLAQSLAIMLAVGALFVLLVRNDLYTEETLGRSAMWVIWLLPAVWALLAQMTLLSRSGIRRSGALLVALSALLASTALYYSVRQADFWTPVEQEEADDRRKQLNLTQEVMEAQPQLLARRLKEIRPQRPGMIDLYAISFAPYSDEDVFKRESEMVSQVMAQRFDAHGRSLQLVNHTETLEQWPWATPKNLQRAIQRLVALMDRNEDVLFLHLTSHGARDGELAAYFWPMTVDTVKPAELKAWLDAAGIKFRVISISACYSGSWIEPLADDNTLVITAADAEHTSYGCGRRSELTFFGRAMYDEQLRNSTLSFEAAHAAAREIIRKREEEAGKSDGYSNPQIRIGSRIKDHLALLQKRLEAKR